ncbi:MAG: AbrB/MazE/SpoVT family DNA-binding domain-containing protein [Chloroflexi bacterium]|nr:AbrB/MazE/SpoVT family DNA-binding domain-containing protein [Chloroflexota bacterium]
MPLKTSISKWGSDLAVRIPQHIADDLEIKEGTSVEFVLDDNVLHIRKTEHDRNDNDRVVARP